MYPYPCYSVIVLHVNVLALKRSIIHLLSGLSINNYFPESKLKILKVDYNWAEEVER
jgi:hypothetical protein